MFWFALRFRFCPVHVTMGWAECPERFSSLHGSWDGVQTPVWLQGRSLVSRSHSLWWVFCIHLFFRHSFNGNLFHYIFRWPKCISLHIMLCNSVVYCVAFLPLISNFWCVTIVGPFGIVYMTLFVCMQRHCLGVHRLHQGHTLNWRRRSEVTNLLR